LGSTKLISFLLLFCRPIRDEFSTKTKQDYSFVSVLSTVRNGLSVAFYSILQALHYSYWTQFNDILSLLVTILPTPLKTKARNNNMLVESYALVGFVFSYKGVSPSSSLESSSLLASSVAVVDND
jgi:hypothetical protein